MVRSEKNCTARRGGGGVGPWSLGMSVGNVKGELFAHVYVFVYSPINYIN